ncbi:phytoene/squalene synthase family protein [Egicoccus halophilus]|uniref:Phytoene synthase n=1 Tax=Egicoccus halophilus TaxID=1670830 RepID=A0A8J3ETR9_9ACTN|nr:phytoene/squalene synthase family protein [Egicoccus halophilus]GGI04473.1 phytoene synthase [Egicoccus halophilus]
MSRPSNTVWPEVTAVIRQHSTTFWLGTCLMSGERRRATRAVYAACRIGDDAADLSARPQEAVAAWQTRVEQAYLGRPVAPWERALAWAVRRYPVPRPAFHALADGFRSDLGPVRVPTLAELDTYCYRVAGAVGLMVAPICGAAGPEAEHAADQLGRAMQLTNCLRDVGEDLARDRVYLPAELLTAYGVTLDHLRNDVRDTGYLRLMEHLAHEAERRYEIGLAGLGHLTAHRTAVAYAAVQYRGILDELRASRWDNLRRRASVPGARRARLLGSARTLARAGRPDASATGRSPTLLGSRAGAAR